MVASPSSSTVVFVAHGSRSTAANEAHVAHAERLQAATAMTVRPAFLELADPLIGTAIDAAVSEGARHLWVLPYFLYPGRHMTIDIPALAVEAEERHPGVVIELMAEFGADAAVLELLGNQLRSRR